ncbi:MAG TPA: cellulase family glycosylhydrolase, partial [Pilimelia sp.]|nr:cellulase family glycosylhydrolase [Pilimelia sp.]
MRKRLPIIVGAALALVVSSVAFVTSAHAATGIRVASGGVVEANGSEFIMRGVSHAHVWYPSQTSSFAGIKAAGANTVRVVLSGGRWPANTEADVANVISLCKINRLICVLENHDTTGFGEQAGAVTLDQAVDYWISVKGALDGQENYVILNIGNEPIGNNNAASWTQATTGAIGRLRAAGFDHALMVDAPNWGQDWQFVMRDNAQAVFNSDPDRNTIFSVHMYGVFDTAAEITDYLGRFRTAGLPIVVGEFGNNHSDGNPDEDTIMSYTTANRIGYIGWSWSGNGGGVEYLDMVTNFNPAQLTPWGQRIFAGPNGIRAAAREATIYSGTGGGDTTPPSQPGAPTASNVTATGATLSWAASTDNVGVTGYTVVRVNGTTETTVASPTTTTAAITGLTAGTAY